MLSTALAIQEATGKAVHDESVMGIASMIFHGRNEMSPEEFGKALFMYSAHLSALTATLVTSACLTETQMDEMMDTINEFEQLGKDVVNGND